MKRLAVSAIAALLALVATYALLRGYDVLFKKEPNPATVIYAPRIAMFWRVNIGCYVGAMVAVGAFAACKNHFDRTLDVITKLAPWVAALIALQGIFLP